MDSQLEINEKMRAILVDWLIEVHNKFELMPETLYLTVHIVDRYLSQKAIPWRNLQLAGMASMFIVSDFIHISDDAYSREMLLIMEKSILGKLEWSLTVPTFARYIKDAISDQEMESMVFFLAELGLMHYELIRYCPSMIVAAAVYGEYGVLSGRAAAICAQVCPPTPYALLYSKLGSHHSFHFPNLFRTCRYLKSNMCSPVYCS
ncbi:hypothetical protein ACHQM5_004199 [Ranunculus cassubicifolius]